MVFGVLSCSDSERGIGLEPSRRSCFPFVLSYVVGWKWLSFSCTKNPPLFGALLLPLADVGVMVAALLVSSAL